MLVVAVAVAVEEEEEEEEEMNVAHVYHLNFRKRFDVSKITDKLFIS